ncbi:FAD-binding protein [Enterovibrio sp. 27052020O]|uniref:FAD-binding oxidoreductase n=1 Tax=Enterovibrio sp. 27052020O TaxID=3241166 RepID=UPI0038903E49
MTNLTGWGRYPVIDSTIYNIEKHTLLDSNPIGIARGLGRSYGDSSLSKSVIQTKRLSRFINFDSSTGVLRCESGVSIDDILQVFVPLGWFPYVTPGTKYVTVGGAIASDVHGKNHHKEGSFCDYVKSLTVLMNGELIICSPEVNTQLFKATCGGMGLTGVIIEATIILRRIESSYIDQKIVKAANLGEALALFEKYNDFTYSVAWIDCLSTGDKLGRSLVMLGEHSVGNQLNTHKEPKLTIPFEMPSQVLNQYSIQAFNALYYNRLLKKETNNTVGYDSFFYPLDSVNNWNLMYGSKGFTQYQFVIPKESGIDALKEILSVIAESKQGSFLAVLKVFREGNGNYLSFPIEGYTLALDFKITDSLFTLLKILDQLVIKYSGRLYLSKDVRMDDEMFKSTYENWEDMAYIREQYNLEDVYSSLQSKRIGL